MYDILSLGEMLLPELRKIAEKFEIPHKGLKKQDLAYKILDYQAINPSKFKSVDSKLQRNQQVSQRLILRRKLAMITKRRLSVKKVPTDSEQQKIKILQHNMGIMIKYLVRKRIKKNLLKNRLDLTIKQKLKEMKLEKKKESKEMLKERG